ncbi:MAG: monothiol glutaredoxin, Grx4 family, partial [Euryarchaeota archaeon]|nr:monothiol glutaredoxin, Grx4 family [Euryarchaeota archaeon]
HGELIGGSDIALEMLQDGSLRQMYDEGRSS